MCQRRPDRHRLLFPTGGTAGADGEPDPLPDEYRIIRKDPSLAGGAPGDPRGQILLSVTHTHSGPNVCGTTGWGEIDRPYCDGILIPRILEAAQEAVEKARPVQMGMAVGDSRVGINRREWREDRIRLGQDPKGPFDPKMTVLSFVDTAGTPVANLIHYGCHGTAAGGNHDGGRGC